MTNKEYLQKVSTIEFAVHGPEKEEALSRIEKERMKTLEEILDIEWVKSMDDGSYDQDLEDEYGDLF